MTDASSWTWDPYKSVHYAASCYCLPGLVYNWKKYRQILCAKKSCYTNIATAGLGVNACDGAFKENKCLYYDSAQYKLTGAGIGQLFSQILTALWKNMFMLGGVIAYTALCYDIIKGLSIKLNGEVAIDITEGCYSFTAATGFWGTSRAVFCGIMNTVIATKEIIDIGISKFGYENYAPSLKGTDYCSESTGEAA